MVSNEIFLDPESAQVRDVYAYYGLAMYWAQCLEQSIFQNLLFFDHFPKAIASYTTPQSWAEEFDRYEDCELGQTMGRLMRRLSEAGQPTTSIEQLLNAALKSRNWLAHGYFADRAIQFTLPDGREIMIAELEEIQSKFKECAHQLDAVTLPAMRKHGFTDAELARIHAEMIEEYASQKTQA
jgi:hypothetical protein